MSNLFREWRVDSWYEQPEDVYADPVCVGYMVCCGEAPNVQVFGFPGSGPTGYYRIDLDKETSPAHQFFAARTLRDSLNKAQLIQLPRSYRLMSATNCVFIGENAGTLTAEVDINAANEAAMKQAQEFLISKPKPTMEQLVGGAAFEAMQLRCGVCVGSGMREESDGRMTTCDHCGGSGIKPAEPT